MGKALELLSGRATAPGATFTALTMAAGNSAQIRNAPFDSKILLTSMWAFNNAAGIFRVRSPKLHDNVQGIRQRITATDPGQVWVPGNRQRLVAQDTLILEITGSAVGGQIEQGQLLIYYDNLPGNDARLIDPDELMRRSVNVLTNEVAITPGVAGGYSGQVAINSTFDLLKANTDYAILGYSVDAACAAVRVVGPDIANLGVGGPGMVTARWVTERWFYHLSQQNQMPLIPVINSANKGGTLVDIVQNQAGAAVNVSLFLNELAPPGSSLK